MFHQTPADEDTKRTKMKKTLNQHLSEYTSPSTSKGPNKNSMTNNMSQIKPLLNNCKDGSMKFIQVSPIKSFPKRNISNMIRITANPLNLTQLPKFQITDQTLQPSNIRILKPIKDIPVALRRMARPLQEILPKSPEKPISGHLASSSGSLSVLSPTNTIATKVSGNVKSKSIPSILQRQSVLITSQNSPEISKQNTKTVTSIPHTETISNGKRNNDLLLPIGEEIIIEKKHTNKSKPNKHEEMVQTKPNASQPAKNKHKEIKTVKSPRRKNRLMKKDTSKDAKDSKISEDSLYVADGFREDVENLLEKCLQVYKLNFEKFTDIWKEMDFPCIFHERQSSAELAELSEEVIHIAKTHMLAKNVSFEENVAGLFLVYALLHHQPFSGFASLRLVPSDVPLLLCLEVEARQQKRHDVLYVLASVLIKGPCQFHVLAREVSQEIPIRKYYDGTVLMSSPMDSVFTRNAECVPHFKELVSLEQRYVAMRQKLRDKHTGRDKISNLCKRPAAMLYELFRAHIPRGRHCDRSPEDLINEILSSSKPQDKRADLLKSIKERAMANVVDPMRHLTGIDERQDSTSNSSDESDTESKPSGRKVRTKGRGRCSATALQELFGFGEKNDETCVPEPSLNAMPALEAIDNLSEPNLEHTPKNQPDKDKLLTKKVRMKLEKDDSKNNNQSASNKRKRKNNIDSPTAKRKATAKNDLIKIDDLVPAEDRIVSSLDISSELDMDDDDFNSDDEESEKFTEKVSNNFPESFNQEINSDLPSITIEIEKMNDDIEIEIVDNYEAAKIHKKEKKGKLAKIKNASVSKNASNSNIVSKNETNKNLKKAEIKIHDNRDLKKDNISNKSLGKVPKGKDASTSNNSTVSKKDIGKDTNLKKAPKIEKADHEKNTVKDLKKEDESKKSKAKKNSPSNPKLDAYKSEEMLSPERTKSPLTRIKETVIDANKSPKMSSPDQVNTPLTPRTKRGSKRIEDQMESPRNDEIKSSPRKRKK